MNIHDREQRYRLRHEADIKRVMQKVDAVLVGEDVGVATNALVNLLRHGIQSIRDADPIDWQDNQAVILHGLMKLQEEVMNDGPNGDHAPLHQSLRSH